MGNVVRKMAGIFSFNKENVAIVISVLALIATLFGQYLPYANAGGRVSPYLSVLNAFDVFTEVACESDGATLKDCEFAYEFADQAVVEKLNQALAIERTHLGAKEFWNIQKSLHEF